MNAPWNSSRKKGGIAAREPFAAFACDDDHAELLRAMCREFDWPIERVQKGGPRQAVQMLSVTASPQILLIDLSESQDIMHELNALAEVCEPGTLVLAMGHINDVGYYRDLIASGIQDYLLKPLSIDALRNAILTAQAAILGARQMHAENQQRSTNIAVIGTRGGVGATTIATSLAWVIAERHRQNAAILDFDIQFGSCALTFDVEPGRGLTDALENPSRIDGLFIERSMVRMSDRLSVLSAEAAINQPLMIAEEALGLLKEEMRNNCNFLVMDIPRTVVVQHSELIQDAEHIILVAEQSLLSTREAIRLSSFIKVQAPAAKVLVITNRVTNTPPPEIPAKDFETSIERKIDFAIPYDPKTATEAARQSQTLAAVAKNAKVQNIFRDLAVLIAGSVQEAEDEAGEKKPSKSLLGGLLGKKSA